MISCVLIIPSKHTCTQSSTVAKNCPFFRPDADIPGATCKNCLGDRMRNKIGQPEKLLHCSKCDHSVHPTCIGLFLELLEYVTNYQWECTECKVCSKCQDHSDEDKMLFCDLCDRG